VHSSDSDSDSDSRTWNSHEKHDAHWYLKSGEICHVRTDNTNSGICATQIGAIALMLREISIVENPEIPKPYH